MSDWIKEYDARKQAQWQKAVDSGFAARAKAFHDELAALEEKYQVTLGHEDGHGSFLYWDALKPTQREEDGTELDPSELLKRWGKT